MFPVGQMAREPKIRIDAGHRFDYRPPACHGAEAPPFHKCAEYYLEDFSDQREADQRPPSGNSSLAGSSSIVCAANTSL